MVRLLTRRLPLPDDVSVMLKVWPHMDVSVMVPQGPSNSSTLSAGPEFAQEASSVTLPEPSTVNAMVIVPVFWSALVAAELVWLKSISTAAIAEPTQANEQAAAATSRSNE